MAWQIVKNQFATESNQIQSRILVPEINPVAVLLSSGQIERHVCIPVILAIIGVFGGMVPYVAAGNMVVGTLMELKNGRSKVTCIGDLLQVLVICG